MARSLTKRGHAPPLARRPAARHALPVRLVRGTPHPALREVVGGYADFAERTGAPRETGAARFAVLDEVLLRRLARAPAPPRPDVDRAWALLRTSGGRVRIEGLARALGCSRRHLAARFAEDVGVPPKVAARLIRFQDARARLGSVPLARLAAEHGFSDQAHLAREFRALGGAPPTAFPSVQDAGQAAA
jgi:transcriptional regulator GlxA family with amidase domain